jgi:ubiquitin-conjugating enzyme E2 G1
MASPGAPAAILLGKQLKRMGDEDHIDGISVGLHEDNIFEWDVMLMISDDTKFYGGESGAFNFRWRRDKS